MTVISRSNLYLENMSGSSQYPEISGGMVLFHLPKDIFDRCFSLRDCLRLEKTIPCVFPESPAGESLLTAWDQWAPRARAVVTGWDSPPITEEMLAVAPHLEAIIHSAGSVRPFIPESIWSSGVRIASCNDALGKGVAETTLGLIIAGLKGFFPNGNLTRAGRWQEAIPETGFGRVRELYDVTIGIIGASRTGRHVLRLLSEFEAEIVLYDPTVSEADAALMGVRLVSLDELMRESDVVSLHAPALPQLRHMLGAREFSAMKDDAIFINTARGMLVDESALMAELETMRISAILDITYPEPPSMKSLFRSLPNVTLLPHIAGAISTGNFRQGSSTVDQLLELLGGQTMSGEINYDQFIFMA